MTQNSKLLAARVTDSAFASRARPVVSVAPGFLIDRVDRVNAWPVDFYSRAGSAARILFRTGAAEEFGVWALATEINTMPETSSPQE